MAKLPRVTARQALRALQRAGWYRHHQKGSHLVLKHPDKPAARVTIPVHAGETLYPKTLLSILDQAGMTAEEFREFL
jgi:predicted RNA binding protein YcfA (HicA-like mRNA interferase family)